MCPPENDRKTRKLEFTVVIGRWKIHHVSHVLIFIFLDFLIVRLVRFQAELTLTTIS